MKELQGEEAVPAELNKHFQTLEEHEKEKQARATCTDVMAYTGDGVDPETGIPQHFAGLEQQYSDYYQQMLRNTAVQFMYQRQCKLFDIF